MERSIFQQRVSWSSWIDSTSSHGGNGAHNNMQPSLAVAAGSAWRKAGRPKGGGGMKGVIPAELEVVSKAGATYAAYAEPTYDEEFATQLNAVDGVRFTRKSNGIIVVNGVFTVKKEIPMSVYFMYFPDGYALDFRIKRTAMDTGSRHRVRAVILLRGTSYLTPWGNTIPAGNYHLHFEY